MEFEISHITDYTYQNAAAEAYLEARLTPPDLPSQTVRSRKLIVEPAVKLSGYTDYFGNAVDFSACRTATARWSSRARSKFTPTRHPSPQRRWK